MLMLRVRGAGACTENSKAIFINYREAQRSLLVQQQQTPSSDAFNLEGGCDDACCDYIHSPEFPITIVSEGFPSSNWSLTSNDGGGETNGDHKQHQQQGEAGAPVLALHVNMPCWREIWNIYDIIYDDAPERLFHRTAAASSTTRTPVFCPLAFHQWSIEQQTKVPHEQRRAASCNTRIRALCVLPPSFVGAPAKKRAINTRWASEAAWLLSFVMTVVGAETVTLLPPFAQEDHETQEDEEEALLPCQIKFVSALASALRRANSSVCVTRSVSSLLSQGKGKAKRTFLEPADTPAKEEEAMATVCFAIDAHLEEEEVTKKDQQPSTRVTTTTTAVTTLRSVCVRSANATTSDTVARFDDVPLCVVPTRLEDDYDPSLAKEDAVLNFCPCCGNCGAHS